VTEEKEEKKTRHCFCISAKMCKFTIQNYEKN